jgi:hypothetical protein
VPLPAFDMITWSGIFGEPTAPSEIWSFSIKTNPANSNSPSPDTAQQAFTSSLPLFSPMPGNVWLTRVRHSHHDVGGAVAKRADGSYDQADHLELHSGGRALEARWPLQTALCVSLDTARAGASGKGRFFLPMPLFNLTAGFTINVNDAQTIATAVNNMFRTWDTATEGSPSVLLGTPVVASAGGTKNPGPGHLSTVTGIRVGLVPDTMRSRRNALAEGYIKQPRT